MQGCELAACLKVQGIAGGSVTSEEGTRGSARKRSEIGRGGGGARKLGMEASESQNVIPGEQCPNLHS